MRTRTLLIAALATALSACAGLPQSKDAQLIIETVPEGAMLYEAGEALGPAPVTRVYKHDGKSETLRTPEVTAVWPSGARERFWTVLPPGADRAATIERPKNAPGLQVDLDNAKKYIAARELEERRAKEGRLRDQARASQRCRDQMSKGNAATNDCN
jgi:hypothetical protein